VNYKRLTIPLWMVSRPVAKASQPTRSAISWTRAFVSRALQSLDRSWEILARTHGCLEMWTLTGSEVDEAIAVGLFYVMFYNYFVELNVRSIAWKLG